ncbi:MAG: site-2 protease family protein [Patescibacteria group bacterium]
MEIQIQSLIFLYVVILFSAVIHEYFHAWTADMLGDRTARMAGRLTINPIAHMDLWGTVMLPLLMMSFFKIFIGYAKPVPFNPYNIKNKHGTLLVGLAGPTANMLIAIIFGIVLRLFFSASPFGSLIALIVYINIFLALFNLIPIPPLDGSKLITEILPYRWRMMWQDSFVGIFVAVMIAFWILPKIASFFYLLITGQSF